MVVPGEQQASKVQVGESCDGPHEMPSAQSNGSFLPAGLSMSARRAEIVYSALLKVTPRSYQPLAAACAPHFTIACLAPVQ